ncbi:membrane protein [Sulfuricella sp. T08]|uniref:type I restriction-modification system subunit M n=1 Tax=Sulfuricella sp. T08 TaxID=1632857 RepID=UPI000617A061|nr:class I SAM-dependent DNA methyltransferase [Sulfuricella sp. T08]GAO37299.1 membrane protein [Sulfuricella sp. T08]
MHWIAPSERDTATDTLEKRLWSAADQFRANSGLTAAQYSAPVLGLIFLLFAETRFTQRRAALLPSPTSGRGAGGEGASRRASRADEPAAYHAEGVIFLPPSARFDHLLNLPEGANVGQLINDAMAEIEKHNPQLAGVLPRTYQIFTSTLLKELLKKVSEIPVSLDYDAFGRIYEYFLGEFARTEGQKGGEFYTPSSIVRLLVEVIEPFHGRILDPACGSGGMFVQSARFVAEHQRKPPSPAGGRGAGGEGKEFGGNPADELLIHGVEKTDDTGRLARMNLAIHGLEGDIRHGGHINSYYDDPHEAVGKFDFVLANPPFNVNAVDKDRLASEVGAGRRYPFGLPRTDNANMLWIQLFYSSLNATGRAGFVMANSASDARSSEQEIRKQLIEARTVDVMVAVGPNLFYTVTLPCTLWFLDKGKASLLSPAGGRGAGGEGAISRADTILFIDARHLYRQIDRAHRDWSDAQIGFIANIVRLYRNEAPDYTLGGEEAQTKLAELFLPSPASGRGAGGEGDLAYRDIPGLCKAATLAEIEAQGWSLNAGRYVGVATGEAVSDEDFKEKLETLNEELEVLNAQARELEQTIALNVAEILES